MSWRARTRPARGLRREAIVHAWHRLSSSLDERGYEVLALRCSRCGARVVRSWVGQYDYQRRTYFAPGSITPQSECPPCVPLSPSSSSEPVPEVRT